MRITRIDGATGDLSACHALRRAVFIEEQAIPEAEEWDSLDAAATHLLATAPDGRALGTARVYAEDGAGHIGRVCVLAETRGTGLGAALIREGIDVVRAMGLREARLGAQCHALGFYEKLGFVAEGPVYDDAGIPHRAMRLTLG